MNKIEIVGRKFGKLLVTGDTKQTSKSKLYKCICECGNIKYHTKQNLLKGTLVSCGCFKKQNRGKLHKNWRGHKNLSGTFFDRIKNIAKRKEIPFTVNIEYLGNLYDKQHGKCAISGKEITMPMSWKEIRTFSYTASLDRIDSSKNYEEGNLQWVHKDINMMKQQLDQPYFLSLCREIVKFNETKI